MAQSKHIGSLKTLHTADIRSQISTLRMIKNDIAGHELRKREYVQEGLISRISQLLQHTADTNNTDNLEPDYHKLWAQAADIITVVANGGPSFVLPILHSALLPSFIARACSVAQPKDALSALKTLNAIADNLPLSLPDVWTPDKRLANLLYRRVNIRSLIRLVNEKPVNFATNRVCDAALALICKTCTTNAHKQALVDEGLLTSLCKRISSFIIAEGFVVPGYNILDKTEPLPVEAPSFVKLSPTLEVLSLIAESSKASALLILKDSAVVDLLPSGRDDFSPSDVKTSPWGDTYFSGAAVPRAHSQTPLDSFLPHIPDIEKSGKQELSSFPPLGTATSIPKRRSSSMRVSTESHPAIIESDASEDMNEPLLIPWLLYMARVYTGRRRMVTCRLLVTFDSYKLVTPSRSRSFRALLAPLLVQMLDDECPEDDENNLLLTRLPYVKAVPAVLSQIIEDDEDMQSVAVEAKAISKLANSLKTNFDQLDDQRPLLWKPYKINGDPTAPNSIECTLGAGGPSIQARHTMVHREGLLGALAAIAPDDDNYRKEVCDQGVLAQIMLALEPFSSDTQVTIEDGPTLKTTGNSASTLLAACNAVRALTRSVTALRTRLVDADVSKAIIKLMHNSDPEVRIAATKVVANLVIDFSPMKSTINTSDMIKKLCQQVHSANARLRLESIWALKNLAFNAENKDKREIIDELGANWIRHLLATDPYDIPPGEVIGLIERDYPPRNSHATGDIVMSDGSEDESMNAGASSQHLDEDEAQYNKHTVEDDLAIQEQLFDLVRNLFCGTQASDIVEYLLGEIGHNEFMKILSERLRSRTLTGATRRNTQTMTPPRGIIECVLGTIVHIAASAPRLRSVLMSSTALMKQVAGLCSHSDHKIRVQCCWIVINLTYEDDGSDRQACARRGLTLHQMGFSSQMQRLEGDPVSDVKERAKTANNMLNKAIS